MNRPLLGLGPLSAATTRGWWGAALRFAFVAHAVLAWAGAAAQGTPVAPDRSAVLSRSVDALTRSRSVSAERSANELGWECLAMLRLAEGGNPDALRRARLIADELTKDRVDSKDGGQGWTASIASSPSCPVGQYDAFGDRTCNPADTAYAFQTGLAISCLALASVRLDDPAMLRTAKEAFWSWEKVIVLSPLCPDCVYFPTSNHANDRGRFVRNMNVFMALGAVSLGVAGDALAGRVGKAAMQSELAEWAAGNRGYLGMPDPQWKRSKSEADRIENHSGAIAVISALMGDLAREPAYRDHGLAVWRAWADCDNERCRKASCSYWAADPQQCQVTHAAAHCAFAAQDRRAAELCAIFMERARSTGSYAILAWELGRQRPATTPTPRKK